MATMNLRQRHNLLDENIKLKEQNSQLEKKLYDLMGLLENKMSLMVDVLNQIKDKPQAPTTIINEITKKDENSFSAVSSPSSIFIPTPDSSNLKTNLQEIQKKRRLANIDDSIDKLSKL